MKTNEASGPGSDFAREMNAALQAHHRRRAVAAAGAMVFALLIGVAIGSLVANGAHLVLVLLISIWGTWGMFYITTRH